MGSYFSAHYSTVFTKSNMRIYNEKSFVRFIVYLFVVNGDEESPFRSPIDSGIWISCRGIFLKDINRALAAPTQFKVAFANIMAPL